MKHRLLTAVLVLALLLTGHASANTGDDFGNGPTIVRLHSDDFHINGTGTLVGVHRYGNRLNMVILATEHTARRMGTMTRVGFQSIGIPIFLPGGVTIDVPLDSSVTVRTARYGANGTTDMSLIGLTIDLNRFPHPVPASLPLFPPATLAVAPPAPFTFNCHTYGTDGGAFPGFGFRNKFSNVVDSIAPFTGSYTTDSANNPLTYTQQRCQWDFDTDGGVPGEGAVGAGGEGSPIVVNGSVVGIQVTGSTAPYGVSTGVVFDAADVAWLNSKINELLPGGGDLSFLATSGGALNPSFDPNLGALTPAFQPDIKNYTQTTTATHMTCFPIRSESGSIVQSRINGGTYFTVDAKPPISTGGDAGGTHCWAIRDDGSVASWGHARHGAASVPANLTNVKEISVGGDHGIALFQDGTVSGWGGWVKQEIFYPAIPAGLFGITQVCTGSQHTFLLSEMGKVTAYGQYVADRALDPPASLTDVSAIATGNDHGLALKRDGTVVAWGSSPMTNVPVGLNNVVAIAASEYTSMALKRDGNVVVWGDNRNGQNDIPSYLQGNIVAITAGNRSVIVLYRDGTIGRWGSLTPILPNRDIPGILGGDLVGVASYYNTHFVQRNDGLIIGWGYNASLAADAPAGLTTSRSSATPLMALNPGLNTVEFKVTPPSGRYPQTYTIAVNRLVEAPPTVSALTPVQVLSNTATFSVNVNPRGRSTEMRLQYSTDQSFDLTSPYVDVPAGHFPVMVNRTISGLQPGTTYFCRMRAVNIQGTTYSPVFQFTTELPAIPTISGLPPQEVLKGGVSPWLDFTVGPGPYAGQITVTAASGDPTLLPVSGIEFDSAATGAVRRLRLKPVCGRTGPAAVTLTATLGLLTATTTFTVNVVDRPPAEAAQIVALGSLPAFGGGENSSGLLISGDGNVVAGRSSGRTFRWTAGGGLQDLNMFSDPQTNMITLTGISTDGSVIGGYIQAMPEAYLWTSNFGLYQALADPFQLNGLSGGGSVAVGHQNNPTPMNQPVRWTEAAGIQNLPKPNGATEVSATAISSDGMVVVGWGAVGVQKSALVWLDTISNPVTLLSVNGGLSAAATAVSADGGVIVGYSDSAAHPGIHRAVRWVRDGFTNNYTAYVLDGVAPTTHTEARGVSADGSRIVGTIGSGFFSVGAFVWDAENGQRLLQTALAHGGANVNANWSSLDEANGISADGLYITGTGTRSSTLQKEAFRAKLPRIPPTPTISAIADVTILSNTATQPIPFTLTDADSNPACLGVSYALSNLTLVPVQNVVISGTGANRTLTVTPAAGQTGQVMIVLTVSDGFSSSDAEFIVNVVSAGSLDGWRLTHFGSAASTGNGALTADPNLNGRTNLEEFAFGTNPLGNQNGAISYANGVVNQRGSPVPVITGPPGNQQFLAVFCRRANWQAVGLTYTVLFSADLMNKVPSATIPTVLATDGEIEVVAVPYPATIEVGGQNVEPKFFQVRITKTP